MSTPIFDSVMADQGIEVMPLPKVETHREFMVRHGYPQWLGRITSGKWEPKKTKGTSKAPRQREGS